VFSVPAARDGTRFKHALVLENRNQCRNPVTMDSRIFYDVLESRKRPHIERVVRAPVYVGVEIREKRKSIARRSSSVLLDEFRKKAPRYFRRNHNIPARFL